MRVRASEEILYTNAALKRKRCEVVVVVVVVVVVDMESENRDVGPKKREKRDESRERGISHKNILRLCFFSPFFGTCLPFADFGHKKKKRKKELEELQEEEDSSQNRARVIREEEEEESERREKKKPREGRQFVLERAATRI